MILNEHCRSLILEVASSRGFQFLSKSIGIGSNQLDRALVGAEIAGKTHDLLTRWCQDRLEVVNRDGV